MACFWFGSLLLERQDTNSWDLLHSLHNAESLLVWITYRNAFRDGRVAPNNGSRGIIVYKHALEALRCISVGPLIPRASREEVLYCAHTEDCSDAFPALSQLSAQAKNYSRNLVFSQVFNVIVWLASIESSQESIPCAGDTRKYDQQESHTSRAEKPSDDLTHPRWLSLIPHLVFSRRWCYLGGGQLFWRIIPHTGS